MTLTFYRDYQELFQGCVARYDFAASGINSPTVYNIMNFGTYDGTITDATLAGTDPFGKSTLRFTDGNTTNNVAFSKPITSYPYTVVLVINIRTFPTVMRDIFAIKPTDSTYGDEVRFHQSYELITVSSDNSTKGTMLMDVDTWYCIFFNPTSGTVHNLYLNGVVPSDLNTTNRSISNQLINTSNMYVGKFSTGSYNGAGFDISDLLIYNRTLTSAEMLTLTKLLLKKKLYPILPGVRGAE